MGEAVFEEKSEPQHLLGFCSELAVELDDALTDAWLAGEASRASCDGSGRNE